MKTRIKVQLFQRAVDGTQSDHDKEEWQALLQSHPELRQELATQKEMVRMLDAMPAIQPPAHLSDAILKAVTLHKASRTVNRRAFRIPAVNINYVYSFSAGLALGLLLLFVFSNDLFDPQSVQTSNLSGTMQISDSGWQSKTIAGAKIHGQISWKNDPSAMDVQLILKPQESAVIVFTYAEDHLHVRGIRNDAGAPLQGLHMDEGELTLAVSSLCKLQLSFERRNPETAPVHVLIKKNNELYFSYQLD